MLVSKKWLQKFFDVSLPGTQELAQGLMFHAFEVEGIEKVGNDEVLDLKVLQRGHDCLSHRGVAKELSAILQLPLNVDPLKKKPDLSKITQEVAVTLEDPSLCPRYIAAYIKGVQVGPSPQWLKQALEVLGQRSINNVVDATNFVLFNIGQPLHAFDADKLVHDGRYSIIVRRAKAGEWLRTLDGRDYVLEDSMLVIADQNADLPIGIAGVKGGMPAAIGDETKNIIIESANFNAVSVRKTAQALKLRTDASTRFEQGISPELAARGMQQAVELIAAIAQGELVGYADVYPAPQESRSIAVSVAQVQQLLGITFGEKEVVDTFTRLGFVYHCQGDTLTVDVPFERLDLQIPEDLVEEVGRIVGYEHIPATALPPPQVKPAVNANFYTAEHAREELVAQGYSEVFTSVFSDAGERVVLNKVDGVRPYLRGSLLPGLQEALKKNITNKELLGLQEIKLFEIGTAWKGGKEVVMLGTISEKEKGNEKPLEPIDAEQYGDLPLSTAIRYQPFSKYPYIVRDIALWVPAETNAMAVAQKIHDLAGDLVRETPYKFDEFKKGEKTSLAFRLVFQSFDRTLTEAEVNIIMEKVAATLTAQGFEIR